MGCFNIEFILVQCRANGNFWLVQVVTFVLSLSIVSFCRRRREDLKRRNSKVDHCRQMLNWYKDFWELLRLGDLVNKSTSDDCIWLTVHTCSWNLFISVILTVLVWTATNNSSMSRKGQRVMGIVIIVVVGVEVGVGWIGNEYCC